MKTKFVSLLILAVALLLGISSCNKKEKEAAALAVKQQQIADSISLQKNFELNLKSFSDNPLVFFGKLFLPRNNSPSWKLLPPEN